jgi:hypothetical protein
METANSYARFQSGAWLSALTLDKSPVPELSLPYCGWPPLYMTGLCLLSLTGLPFWTAALCYSALLTVMTGVVAVRVARLCPGDWPPALVFFLAVACPAYGMQFQFAYPVILVPLSCLLPVWAALVIWQSEGSARRQILLAAGAGLVASLSTWVAYMTAPALFLAFYAAFRLRREAQAMAAAKRVMRWSVLLGLWMVAGFVIFKLLCTWVAGLEPGMGGPISGGAAKLKERMLPGGKVVLAAWFYAAVRGGWVLLPVFLLAVVLRLRFWRRPLASLASTGGAVLLALLLAPLIFTLLLPGEMGQPAHIFHGVGFIPLAALLPILAIPYSRKAGAAAAVIWVTMGLVFLLGGRWLPALALESPRTAAYSGWILEPGDYTPQPTASPLGARSLVRTVLRNGFRISATDARAAVLDPAAAWRQSVQGEPGMALRAAMQDRVAATGWTSDATLFSYVTGRPFLECNNLPQLEERLAGFNRLGLLARCAIVLPHSADRKPAEATAACMGCRVVLREVPGTPWCLLLLEPIHGSSLKEAVVQP